MNTSIDTMAFTAANNLPVIGNGKRIPTETSIDNWYKSAGFFDVKESPVKFDTDSGVQVDSDRKVLYRHDNYGRLGIVGKDYQTVQPHTALTFFQDVFKGVDMPLVFAGTVKGGQKLWAVAHDINSELNLSGDKSGSFYLIITSFDGSTSTVIKKISLRYICANILSMGGKVCVRIPHSRTFCTNAIRNQLIELGHIAPDNAFNDMAENLASRAITDNQSLEFITELFAKRDDSGEIENEKTLRRVVPAVFDSVKHSPGANMPSANGTQWGLLNGVTHYVDHVAPARSEENRFNSAVSGSGEMLKQSAVDMLGAVQYAEAPVINRQPAVDLSQVCVKDDMARLMAM